MHYIKSMNPRFQEQGHIDNPKGKVSPGEGVVEMVRILPVRPAGTGAPLGMGGARVGGGTATEESFWLALGSVGWGRLELVDDLILRRVGLILLHLREQLQRLLLFLCRVVAQEVGCCGQD